MSESIISTVKAATDESLEVVPIRNYDESDTDWKHVDASHFFDLILEGSITKLQQHLEGRSWLLDWRTTIETKEGALSWLHVAAKFGKSEIAQWFIGLGQCVDDLASGFNSPLDVAVNEMHVNVAELLLKAGADPNSPHKSIRPLHTAIRWKGSTAPAMVRLLVEFGADVEAVDPCGLTALGDAVRLGQIENVKALLRCGAPVHAGAVPDPESGTMLDAVKVARKHDQREIVEILEAWVSAQNAQRAVEKVLDVSPSNLANSSGLTPL